MKQSIIGIPATIFTEHRTFTNMQGEFMDECWLLWIDNKLHNAYSTLEDAQQAAREYYNGANK